MFKPRRTHLLILLSFQLLASLALGQTVTCDPNNRPTVASCSSQPIRSVCGYTQTNCPLEICGIEYDKECLACADPQISHYTVGSCPQELRIRTCSWEWCPNSIRAIFNPICAFHTENGQVVSETLFNDCDYCQDNNVNKYIDGVCPKDRELCTPGKLGCTREKDTCAWLYGRTPTTTSSIAEACKDPAVTFFTKGACGPLEDDRRYCLPNNRPEDCDGEDDPVCGFTSSGHEIMPSACDACSNPAVNYWIPGPCVFKCILDEELQIDCAGFYVPVCGTWIENGVEKKASFRNDCLGCYYSGRQVLTWTEGLCPGDPGIKCENDSDMYEEFAQDREPVCGYKQDWSIPCEDSSCRTSFASARFACGDSSIVWFSIGYCDGDGPEEEEETREEQEENNDE